MTEPYSDYQAFMEAAQALFTPEVFYLHGHPFESAAMRKHCAESHHLWSNFCEYYNRRFNSLPVSVDDPDCREVFEIFIEGACAQALFNYPFFNP